MRIREIVGGFLDFAKFPSIVIGCLLLAYLYIQVLWGVNVSGNKFRVGDCVQLSSEKNRERWEKSPYPIKVIDEVGKTHYHFDTDSSLDDMPFSFEGVYDKVDCPARLRRRKS